MASILQAIKVSGAVSANTSSTGTLYTAPANSYAIVQLYAATLGGQIAFTLDGKTIYAATSSTQITITNIYVGPGQALACSVNSASVTVNATGVQFGNTT